MNRLEKYVLDREVCWDYIADNLNGTNQLSSQIFKTLSQKMGFFYVLLSPDLDLTKGQVEQLNRSHFIPNMDKWISNYMVDKIEKLKAYCIFDDVNIDKEDVFRTDSSWYSLGYFEDEVYYIIKKEFLSEESFLECMTLSDGIWHSLCVITTVDLGQMIDQEISLDLFQKIAESALIVMIGAYDGESYLFWEKSL